MKKIKKLTASLLAAVIALSGVTLSPEDAKAAVVKVDTAGFESVSVKNTAAIRFVNKMQLGWNLGNTFDAYDCTWLSDELEYETAWTSQKEKTSEALIKAIKKQGFNTIRIPVSWHNHVDSKLTISDAWMDRVQTVVDYAYNNGMYVILNIHHDDEQMQPTKAAYSASKKYVKTIWKQIAKRFKSYGDRLIFETMNEPRNLSMSNPWWFMPDSSSEGQEAMNYINKLNQVAVDTIRTAGGSNNKKRYIMVPGYAASPDFTLTDYFKLPTDKNASKSNRILVSIHAYRPYSMAFDGSGRSDFNDADKTELNTFMKQAYERFTSKGIGVVIGEFGIVNKDNTAERAKCAAYYVALARHYGMTAVWWDNNAFGTGAENFGLFDRKTNKVKYSQIVEQLAYYSK